MRTIRRFLARIRNFSTNRLDHERLRDEIEAHIEAQTEELVRAGVSPEEAHRQAVLKFGEVQAIRESYHTEEGLPSVDHCFSWKYGWVVGLGHGSTMHLAVKSLALVGNASGRVLPAWPCSAAAAPRHFR